MTVNCYDIVIILDPKLTENNVKDLITKSKKVISSAGGEILTEDNWGIRKISHPIKRNRDGFYYFMKAKLNGDKINEIKYNIKVMEGILRINLIKSLVEVVK
ncbi:MAG: 30S ribosomal protein S6 [Elusimicrobiales bacterium]|jgi:small subunit ribosomal protein S6|nr:30S ribosomal protein S6 [Elusimicrobiales bacterium]HOL62269.1 30S ribosomal protein S6 [Elusimicrobiales bacterium]HPO95041.1 30S ribosomal protein S6 [Elusimicrobiales bacterium]